MGGGRGFKIFKNEISTFNEVCCSTWKVIKTESVEKLKQLANSNHQEAEDAAVP